jgi:hypothetical protein
LADVCGRTLLLLCWQNNNRLVAGLALLKTSKMMTVADPQEAFEGLIKGSSKTRMSLQPANKRERRAVMGRARRMTRRMAVTIARRDRGGVECCRTYQIAGLLKVREMR